MAEDYVEYLRLAREVLVEDRRRIVRGAVDDPKQADKEAKPRKVDLTIIQKEIAAVDDAIADEEKRKKEITSRDPATIRRENAAAQQKTFTDT